ANCSPSISITFFVMFFTYSFALSANLDVVMKMPLLARWPSRAPTNDCISGRPTVCLSHLLASPHGLVIKHWDKIRAWFGALWNSVKAIFKTTWESIKSLFLNYTPQGLVIQHWDKIVAWFGDLWKRVTVIFSGFVKWLFGLGTTFWNAGKNIIDSIWKGMKSAIHKPVEAIKGIVSKVRDYLPFSPAKTGALKDIHRIRLVETIAQSIKANPLIKAMSHVTDQVFHYKGQPLNPLPVFAGSREPS